MLKWKFKKPKIVSPGLCGIRFASEGIALAHVIREDAQSKPVLAYCDFIPCQRHQREETLSKVVTQQKLHGVPCVWILSPTSYRLLSLEPLPVMPDEMLNAIRWHIKDQIDFPVSEASLEYFTLPHQGKGKKEDWIYVVAAKKDYLMRRADLIRASGLNLTTIDIPELSYRNIIDLYDSQQGIGLIGVRKDQAILLIIRKHEVQMIRHLNLGIAANENTENNENNENIMERLLLEVERSLDYYENALGEAPLEKLLIAPPYENVLPIFKEKLNCQVQGLDFRDVLVTLVEMTQAKEVRCADAVCAALRQEVSDASTN